jgi:hypothetical protein
MRSRRQLEIATHGRFSWMPYTPQGLNGLDNDDDDDDNNDDDDDDDTLISTA